MRDVFEDVETRDILRGEERRRVRLRLLKDRREDVAGFGFVALRGLDVEHRRLERAAEGRRLFGLAAPCRVGSCSIESLR